MLLHLVGCWLPRCGPACRYLLPVLCSCARWTCSSPGVSLLEGRALSSACYCLCLCCVAIVRHHLFFIYLSIYLFCTCMSCGRKWHFVVLGGIMGPWQGSCCCAVCFLLVFVLYWWSFVADLASVMLAVKPGCPRQGIVVILDHAAGFMRCYCYVLLLASVCYLPVPVFSLGFLWVVQYLTALLCTSLLPSQITCLPHCSPPEVYFYLTI